MQSPKDSSWWIFTLPAFLGSKNLLDEYILLSILISFISIGILTWFYTTGGVAWKNGRNRLGTPIPGPRGIPVFGSLFDLSRGLAHRTLAKMAETMNAKEVTAFSIGSTPAIVSSDPIIAKEILTSIYFADRPIKQSARSLMFTRAMGFAPNGTYWRLLRRIAASHLFSPRLIAAHEPRRRIDCDSMVKGISRDMGRYGVVSVRKHLQAAALNNIMGSVFGKRYDTDADTGSDTAELSELKGMVREGFELLGAFNWSDYLPWISHFYDPNRIVNRCESLVVRVRKFVKGIIEEHKVRSSSQSMDFIDILLSLDGEEKLNEDDMIAVLWEMIFRGTDTTALLTEWAMAELVLHPEVQLKLRREIDVAVGNKAEISDADVAALPYLQAVVKETLRVHPPGPLLSWCRYSTADVKLKNGMVIPAATTAMINMWSITHDEKVWENPLEFKPERFVPSMGGVDIDVRGGDLRLAPFGAGRRVCPGKNLGMVTVAMWVAKLVRHFEWTAHKKYPVDLSELLKLSCEMKNPLTAVAVDRNVPY